MTANINGKVLKVKAIDATYNEAMTEVEILEGTFKGIKTVVANSDLVKEEKTTGKINFAKFQGSDRYMSVEVELTGCNEASDILDKFVEGIGYEVSGCPTEDENKYFDSFEVEYEHGTMTATKNYIKSEWKKFKKENGIR